MRLPLGDTVRPPQLKNRERGKKEERARDLTRNAMYAIHHPGLCATMPHRLFPVRESDEMCIRCGLFVGRP